MSVPSFIANEASVTDGFRRKTDGVSLFTVSHQTTTAASPVFSAPEPASCGAPSGAPDAWPGDGGGTGAPPRGEGEELHAPSVSASAATAAALRPREPSEYMSGPPL